MKDSGKSYLHALLCALAVAACALISLPFTTMNVFDDGPYIRMAHTFANTGHIVYNGWGASMMAAQLCLGAVFIKLFGFSTTSVRMSTLLLAMLTVIVFHRTLVRTGGSQRNANLGTLAVVISPMYLMLSVTFMTDIAGLFAITLCLYGCVRAIQASADRSAIAWICFAVFTCAAFGTSRQLAWLGDLVMVPSTLWLLRSRSRVLIAGTVASSVAFLFILGCMHWLGNQPYAVPVPVIASSFPKRVALLQLSFIVLEIPFLVLPVIAVFIPRIFKTRLYIRFLLLVGLLAYIVIALHVRHDINPILRLEPTASWAGSWFFLRTRTLILLTVVCLGGLLGVIAIALPPRAAKLSPLPGAEAFSWRQLGILLLPFSVVYLMFLGVAVGTIHVIFDRYAIGLLSPAMIVLIRLYQERVQPNLPFATVVLIIIMCAYGIIVTHNTFAYDRARVDLADALRAHGVPYTSIDGGWDYNLDTELNNSNYINNPLIKVPKDAYVIQPPAPAGYCVPFWADRTPHVQALYAISFSPDQCYGKAPFAPVQYRAWPFLTPINLYAVRYSPPG